MAIGVATGMEPLLVLVEVPCWHVSARFAKSEYEQQLALPVDSKHMESYSAWRL